jgi:ABC-type Fe3+/spermidine/putrescine transport system ATPase subunit
VSDLSFDLEAGSVTGFLGPNGAGKTTTLRMLLGLAEPSGGQALVFGRRYAELERPSGRIGAVLDAADLHPGRTGRDQAGAIVALAAYAVAVDALLFAAVPSIGRYLPGKAGDALTGRPVEHLLTPGVGALVLMAWAIAFAAAATGRTDRTDV